MENALPYEPPHAQHPRHCFQHFDARNIDIILLFTICVPREPVQESFVVSWSFALHRERLGRGFTNYWTAGPSFLQTIVTSI